VRTLPVLIVALTVITGCMSAKEKAYIGAWQDSGGGAIYTFEKVGSSVKMTSIKDTDGEMFEVLSSGMEGGYMTWHYRVPSTEYRVMSTAKNNDGSAITYEWSNKAPDGQTNSGTDTMSKL